LGSKYTGIVTHSYINSAITLQPGDSKHTSHKDGLDRVEKPGHIVYYQVFVTISMCQNTRLMESAENLDDVLHPLFFVNAVLSV